MKKIIIAVLLLLISTPVYAFMPFEWTGYESFQDTGLGYVSDLGHGDPGDNGGGQFNFGNDLGFANQFTVENTISFNTIRHNLLTFPSINDGPPPATWDYSIYTGTFNRGSELDAFVPAGSSFVIGQGTVSKSKATAFDEFSDFTVPVNQVTLSPGTYWIALDNGGKTFGLAYSNLQYGNSATPVPEPASLMLFSTGLAGLALRRNMRSTS